MKVGEIMNRTPVSVQLDQTFASAFQTLLAVRVAILPVVDSEGVYRGIFDMKDIWGILLPRAARLERNSIEDLSFVSSSLEKMKDQIGEAAELPMSEFVSARDVPPLSAECPLIQAVLLFDRYGETLAVVDRQTRKLVGEISAWQVLDALR